MASSLLFSTAGQIFKTPILSGGVKTKLGGGLLVGLLLLLCFVCVWSLQGEVPEAGATVILSMASSGKEREGHVPCVRLTGWRVGGREGMCMVWEQDRQKDSNVLPRLPFCSLAASQAWHHSIFSTHFTGRTARSRRCTAAMGSATCSPPS
jgi:hypothetical protein